MIAQHLVLQPHISQLLFSATPCREEQRSGQDSGEESSDETSSVIDSFRRREVLNPVSQ